LVYGVGCIASFWLYKTNGEAAGAKVPEQCTEVVSKRPAMAIMEA